MCGIGFAGFSIPLKIHNHICGVLLHLSTSLKVPAFLPGVLDSGIGWPSLMLSVNLELPICLDDGGPEPLNDRFWGKPDEAVELRRLAWGLVVACSDDYELVDSAVDGGLLRYNPDCLKQKRVLIDMLSLEHLEVP